MNKDLKILINCQEKRGSGPSYSLEWAKGLLKNGCDVYAILAQDVMNKDEWNYYLQQDHIFYIETHKDHNKRDLISKTIRLLFEKRREISMFFSGIEFDFSFHTFYSHWSNIIDDFLNVDRVVSVCHDPIAHSGYKFYMQWLYNHSYKKSDEIIILTKSFKNTVHEQFGTPLENIHYIPHGRMQMYNSYSREMYNSLHFDEHKYNFLYFGFIEHYKGLNVLSAAYRKIREQRKDISLIVAGNGDFSPYKEGFEGLDDVTIINRYIKDEEVGALFAGPNVISILPYLNATQSGVIPIAFEYLTPVIASDTGGLREQLNDGKIGILFECGNVDDLVNKMNNIIDDHEEYLRQQDLMKEYRETLNWEKLADNLLKQIGYR